MATEIVKLLASQRDYLAGPELGAHHVGVVRRFWGIHAGFVRPQCSPATVGGGPISNWPCGA
jgi:hypothetical protein